MQRYMIWQWSKVVIVIMMALFLGSCSEDAEDPVAPTGLERLIIYERSTIPGMQVYINLNSRHIAGQPFGSWQVNASWRDQRNTVLNALNLPVLIGSNGTGTVILPPDFLNAVFQETHNRFLAGDSGLWTQQPGLYLHFYADEQTYAYFDGFNVVGGAPASTDDWPWITGLIQRGKTPAAGHFCGGALIHPEWVLTAAHCLEGDPAIDILIGADNLTASPESYERIAVIKAVAHPAYNPNTLDNDLALLRLARPSSAPIIAWDHTSLAHDGARGDVAGWGATDRYGTVLPIRLMEVGLPVISNALCNQSFRELLSLGSNRDVISGNMFCAGYAEGGKDSCIGDSGGPFVINGRVAGVVSWGPDECARPRTYGVYTRVFNYANWLNSMLQTDVPAEFVNGWYYGGSLYDLVTQLGLNWQPSQAPLKNLGVSMSIGFIK